MNRPIFNPTNGTRIRYSDSPIYDIYGGMITYGEDRSDPTRWNQMTGEPLNVNVTVNVTPAAAPAPQQAQAPVTVGRLADNVYETYPTYQTTGGRTVRDIRINFSRELGLRDTMIAIVDGEAVGEGTVVNPGSNVTFREGAKARG